MTFSHYAGYAIVPTLSRIVLCVTFITAGYSKFLDDQFSAEQAAELTALGVRVYPKATSRADSMIIKPARFQTIAEPQSPGTQPEQEDTNPPQEQPPIESDPAAPGSTDEDPPVDSAPAIPPVSTQPTTTLPASTQPTTTQPAPEDSFQATRMHHITLMLHAKGWPRPVLLAWMASMTELVAGALLAIGLFSRLWGFALACVMAVAFYLTSWPALGAAGFKLLALDPMQMSTMMLQSALFVLAFGIFLTGAGPLSLDRLLFGGRTEVVEVEEVSTVRH